MTGKNIQQKIKSGTARVYTASELKECIRANQPPALEDVDVVTCATFGVMSGTAAVLSFPVAAGGTFTHARALTLNDVPAQIGPCPNERNGHVDCILFGTAVSIKNPRYGGGHLFQDLAAKKTVHAKITTDTGVIEKELSVADMSCARLIVTRGAFKNYMAFTNPKPEAIETIFSILPLNGDMSGATFSGCGEINPLENDPSMRFHTPGKHILLNGADGILLGTGTRSSPEKPNLSAAADIAGMDPQLMGGFSYPGHAECLTSIATAIPIPDKEALDAASILDEEILLPIADITTRNAFITTTYADAWSGDLRVITRPERCTDTCSVCARDLCARNAISPDKIISGECMGCLNCVAVCPNHVFCAKTGVLHTAEKNIPVILRQSDRVRAETACQILKEKIINGHVELI